MIRKSRFRVMGRLDRAAGVKEGTVVIDRGAWLFTVRPLRSRRVYELPLSTVADMVVLRVLKTEVFKRRMEKAAKKHERLQLRRKVRHG